MIVECETDIFLDMLEHNITKITWAVYGGSMLL